MSSHLPHEANTEQLFSLAGNLSDDNGKMDPYRLSVWVSIAANHKVFKPGTEAILERYMAKLSNGVKSDLDDFGLAPAPYGTGTGTGTRASKSSLLLSVSQHGTERGAERGLIGAQNGTERGACLGRFRLE